MELQDLQHKDFSQRLQEWVYANKKFLVLLLVGGVVFFGLLAAITVWRTSNTNKVGSELLSMVDLAKESQNKEKWDDCIAQYEAVYQKRSAALFFRVLALHGKATCLRGKGDFTEAAQTFERAALEPGHVDSLSSRFEAARSYGLAGDPKAEELYQALLKEKNLSPDLKDKVEEQLLWIKLRKKS